MDQEFTAYFDESETQSVFKAGAVKTLPRENRAVIIAGFLATAEQWERLEENWECIFEQYAFPRGTFFHMVEFAQSVGAFEVFRGNTEERQRFLSQLIGLLQVRVRRSIARALRLKDYDDLDAGLALTEKASPYTFCALAAIEQATKWAKGYGGELKVVFEYGFPDAGQLLELCRHDKFPIPSFEPKEKWRALQAADMVAWESQKMWKKVLKQEARPVRESMKAIRRIRNDWADYTPENLLASAQHLGCEPRSTFRDPCPRG
jgi:hypothetical protein